MEKKTREIKTTVETNGFVIQRPALELFSLSMDPLPPIGQKTVYLVKSDKTKPDDFPTQIGGLDIKLVEASQLSQIYEHELKRHLGIKNPEVLKDVNGVKIDLNQALAKEGAQIDTLVNSKTSAFKDIFSACYVTFPINTDGRTVKVLSQITGPLLEKQEIQEHFEGVQEGTTIRINHGQKVDNGLFVIFAPRT